LCSATVGSLGEVIGHRGPGYRCPSPAPGPLRGVSDALPVGAGVQAIQDAAAGRWASGLYFGVLAAWVMVCGVLAVRLFRWE
jgi:ABC-type multidrug transport system permease subunit